MKRSRLLLGAILGDAIVGDPPVLPHPVRAIGWAIARGEHFARAAIAPTPQDERRAGALLTLAVVATTFVFADRVRRSHGLVELAIASSALALRNLCDEASAVTRALETDDLLLARHRLARIVGRDTDSLDATEIARATIETLAESTCDGIVAPLLYLTVGGVPLAYAYKAVNTLDSMIGHPEPPYRDFGRFAARLDDLANYLPARMAASCIVIAAGILEMSAPEAWQTWRREASRHRSPNAGQSEAAMAGALRVRLGGENRYDDRPVQSAIFGERFRAARTSDIARAKRIVAVASIIAYTTSLVLVKAAERLA